MKTVTTTTTTVTATSKRRISSLYVTKYIKNIQQANERTAEEYEYRLSRFEKYIAEASDQQQQQQLQNQDPITAIKLLQKMKTLTTTPLSVIILKANMDSRLLKYKYRTC
jgi:hypothetical protein